MKYTTQVDQVSFLAHPPDIVKAKMQDSYSQSKIILLLNGAPCAPSITTSPGNPTGLQVFCNSAWLQMRNAALSRP